MWHWDLSEWIIRFLPPSLALEWDIFETTRRTVAKFHFNLPEHSIFNILFIKIWIDLPLWWYGVPSLNSNVNLSHACVTGFSAITCKLQSSHTTSSYGNEWRSYSEVTRALWRLKWAANCSFVQHFVVVEFPYYWPFVPLNPRTKGQWCGNPFRVMTCTYRKIGIISCFASSWQFNHRVSQRRRMASYVLVNIGSSNDLLPDGTKTLPVPTLTNHQFGLLAFTRGKLRRKH